MGWFNSNSVHNFINFAIQVVGYGSFALKATGCVDTDPGAGETFDCSRSLIPSDYAGLIVGAFGTAKTVINMVRDGLGGLIKVQPPVADATTTVVTPVKVVSKTVVTPVKVVTRSVTAPRRAR